MTFADRGAQRPFITPYWKHKGRKVCTAWNRQVNRDHANATLKQ